MAHGKQWLRVLLRLLGALLTAALLALAAFSLILARPQDEPADAAAAQPLLTASPALDIHAESDLAQLLDTFPIPVMSFMSGSGMSFVSATSADAAVSGGFGRIASLYWQTADGLPLILQSIYPASGLTLLESGYHFSNTLGPTLLGQTSVRMEKGDTIRLHTETEEGLYVLLLPRSLEKQISALCRSLQLFRLEKATQSRLFKTTRFPLFSTCGPRRPDDNLPCNQQQIPQPERTSQGPA